MAQAIVPVVVIVPPVIGEVVAMLVTVPVPLAVTHASWTLPADGAPAWRICPLVGSVVGISQVDGEPAAAAAEIPALPDEDPFRVRRPEPEPFELSETP